MDREALVSDPVQELRTCRPFVRYLFWCVLVLALAVACINAIFLTGYIDLYDWDFIEYTDQANRILQGRTYSIRFWPPGFPMLLALGQKLGLRFEHTASIATLAGNCLTVLALCMIIGVRANGLATIAALLSMLSSHAVQLAQRSYLPDSLAGGCFLLAWALALKRRPQLAPVAVATLGFALNLKFIYLVPFCLLVAYELWLLARSRELQLGQRVQWSALVLITAVVMLVPWAVFNMRNGKPPFFQINHLNIALGSLAPGIDFGYLGRYEKEFPTMGSLLVNRWGSVVKNWIETCGIYIAYYCGLGHERMWNAFLLPDKPSIRLLTCFLFLSTPQRLKDCWKLGLVFLPYWALISATWFSIRFAFVIEPFLVGLGCAAFFRKVETTPATLQQKFAVVLVVVLGLGTYDVYRSFTSKVSILSSRTGSTKYSADQLEDLLEPSSRIVCSNHWLKFRLRNLKPEWVRMPTTRESLTSVTLSGKNDYLIFDHEARKTSVYGDVLKVEKPELPNYENILFVRDKWAVHKLKSRQE